MRLPAARQFSALFPPSEEGENAADAPLVLHIQPAEGVTEPCAPPTLGTLAQAVRERRSV